MAVETRLLRRLAVRTARRYRARCKESHTLAFSGKKPRAGRCLPRRGRVLTPSVRRLFPLGRPDVAPIPLRLLTAPARLSPAGWRRPIKKQGHRSPHLWPDQGSSGRFVHPGEGGRVLLYPPSLSPVNARLPWRAPTEIGLGKGGALLPPHHPLLPSAPAGALPEGTALVALARCQAHQQEIQGEDAEDCAMEFVLRLLQNRRPGREDRLSAAYLQVCARNHARNFRRGARRYRRRIQEDGSALAHEGEIPAAGRSLLSPLLQEEFWQQIAGALARLDPLPRRVFLAFYLEGRAAGEIAAHTGRSVNAVALTLRRARQQLRRLLERQGITEGDLRAYLALTGEPVGAPHPRAGAAVGEERR